MMKSSFIGLGRMGAPMAARIIQSGKKLTVFNRDAEKAKPLIDLGAQKAASADEAFKGASLVFTMVSNDDALDSVATVSRIGSMAEGGVHVSMSTISVAFAETLSNRHASLGTGFLSCPVFGRPSAAAQGAINLCLAGPSEAKERARPFLEPMGPIYDMGEKASGANAVKIAGNFMIASAIEMMSEAFSLAEKHGVAAESFYNLVSQTNFSCPVVKIYGRLILDESFEPAGFSANLASKDVGLVRAAARGSLTPMPMASVLADRFLRIQARGWGEKDWSVAGRCQREDAGLVKPE
ncbi:MAG: NAD(P)-dependent oxidoreductase [Deltaproteobacteria bacterium]|nr:NAD(P)-dependent oxidoreductase [Deltaproteobacteria bacterium]